MTLNRIVKVVLVVAASIAASSGNAQTNGNSPARNLSLSEAIQLGLQNSKYLKLSEAKVQEATANYHETWNNHLPDLKASGSYLRVSNPDLKLKVKLGSGNSEGGKPNVDQAAYGIVNASVPLFSGLRIKYGVESAKYLENAAKLDASSEREEVIINTINAYSNLYKSMKTIELLKENLNQQAKRITDFTNLESNGVIARNDLLKAQLQQSNVELSLLDAENNYEITCINMNLMLGLPEETRLVADSGYYQEENFNGSVAQWEETALKNRKDLSALLEREKAANAGIKSTKGEYYPGLAITGGYIGADVPNVITITNAFNIGLGLQYNISSFWKTGAKLDASKARLHQLQINESLLTDQLHVQVSQAYQNYLLSKKKTEVYAKAIEQSKENYRITKNKHTNNLVTTTELLEADIAQLQAQLNYAFAKADVVVAFKKLQQAAGTLSESYPGKN